MKIVFAALVALAVLGAGALWWRRHARVEREAEERRARASRGPRLAVTTVKSGSAQHSLTLPADVRGFYQTTLQAKTSGFVARISVQRGDRVRRGEVLAVLSSPETDEEVAEARSDLELKQRTAARARWLATRDFISQQDFDNADAARKVSRATLARVRALQRYEILRAPFDGVVTNRYLDPGALVSTSTAVLDVADLSRVKVLVAVAQDAAPFLRVGDPVRIVSEAHAEEPIPARITRLASALDLRTRTMLVEIWLDNAALRLYPGTSVRVTLTVTAPPRPLVPAAAVSTRDGKLVAGVVRDGRLRIVPITTGVDDGRTVEVLAGLLPGDTIGLNVPPELHDGSAVQPVLR
jgi:RND family efflux transporter MFP subunit